MQGIELGQKHKYLIVVGDTSKISEVFTAIYEAESPELAAAQRLEDSGNPDETVEVFTIGRRLGVYGMPKTWVTKLPAT